MLDHRRAEHTITLGAVAHRQRLLDDIEDAVHHQPDAAALVGVDDDLERVALDLRLFDCAQDRRTTKDA